MSVPGGDAAVQAVTERLEVWLTAISAEVQSARETAQEGGDRAAASYLELISDIVLEIRSNFDSITANQAPPAADRLRWLQQIGGAVQYVVALLERLEGALAPRLTPLVSALERLLDRLLPGKSVVVRPFRNLNYEIGAIHSVQFGEMVKRHPFPFLFLKIPTGFLDSPRNHILVGHELGHAIASVEREAVAQFEQQKALAFREGKEPPPERPSLLPSPPVAPERIVAIAMAKWGESGLPAPNLPKDGAATPSSDLTQFISVFAATLDQAQKLRDDWIEELFADAVGVCLFGPAFVFSFLGVLLPLGPLERASSHPPSATRLLSMKSLLEDPAVGHVSVLKGPSKEMLDAAMKHAEEALKQVPGPRATKSEAMVLHLVHELVEGSASEIRQTALGVCAAVLYTGQDLGRDLATHRESLVALSVPPIGDPAAPATLACIFNVGQIVALEDMARFVPNQPRAEQERRLDDLMLKAIELAEFQVAWKEV